MCTRHFCVSTTQKCTELGLDNGDLSCDPRTVSEVAPTRHSGLCTTVPYSSQHYAISGDIRILHQKRPEAVSAVISLSYHSLYSSRGIHFAPTPLGLIRDGVGWKRFGPFAMNVELVDGDLPELL